jgi:adiponectin receptor
MGCVGWRQVYYSFACSPFLRNMYLCVITTIAICTVLVSLLPVFQTAKYRTFRASLFFGMGISGVVPCIHKLFLYKEFEPVLYQTLYLEILMGLLYGLGALVYATRIPERWKPGMFDIFGNSHQLFHVLVVAGAYTHYESGLLYLKWRDVKGCDTW